MNVSVSCGTWDRTRQMSKLFMDWSVQGCDHSKWDSEFWFSVELLFLQKLNVFFFFCIQCDGCIYQILSLPWVVHTWMSGIDPLQTPRAWFWGTHKWAISAALLAGGVSKTVGNVLVFGPPLHWGIERRSLRQSSWDGYSVCSGLFWGERWWSVGVVAADGLCPHLGCILQSCSGRWLFFLLRIRVLTSL